MSNYEGAGQCKHSDAGTTNFDVMLEHLDAAAVILVQQHEYIAASYALTDSTVVLMTGVRPRISMSLSIARYPTYPCTSPASLSPILNATWTQFKTPSTSRYSRVE
jgi:hypothetical protein